MGKSAGQVLRKLCTARVGIIAAGATTAVAAPTLFLTVGDPASASNDYAWSLGGDYIIGSQFTLASAATISEAHLFVKKGASVAGNTIIQIWTNSSNLPGTLLYSSAAVNSLTLPATLTETTFTFSGATLGSGTYFLVVYVDSSTPPFFGCDVAADDIAGNRIVWSGDLGTSWALDTADSEIIFKLYQ